MNRTLNVFAGALIAASGLMLGRPAPADATMIKPPEFRMRSCCTSADGKNFCCFYDAGCKINDAGCTRV